MGAVCFIIPFIIFFSSKISVMGEHILTPVPFKLNVSPEV